jgi:hypothetical protein
MGNIDIVQSEIHFPSFIRPQAGESAKGNYKQLINPTFDG